MLFISSNSPPPLLSSLYLLFHLSNPPQPLQLDRSSTTRPINEEASQRLRRLVRSVVLWVPMVRSVGQGLCFVQWLGVVSYVFGGWDQWAFMDCCGCQWW
ncbi:hypothetical protein ACB092_06G000600 [Castanea dentata]